MALILASQSPRRKELLAYITPDFTVKVSDADETLDGSLSPEEAVKYLARIKGEAVAKNFCNDTVISADTVVVSDNCVLGKPRSPDEAFTMLRMLSGRTHSVFTGVCIINPDKKICFAEKTLVTFTELSDEEINAYIMTGEPFDKAGGYGIQGRGSVLISSINGDYYNVMGLPVAKLNKVLKENFFI
ncbi:MAG: septum formation inhibitor Maf [Clostridia bacterium]|nr:septum formation inhibitor Maf [Clostridia bacterium]